MRVLRLSLLFTVLFSTVLADDDDPPLTPSNTTDDDDPSLTTPNTTPSPRIANRLNEPKPVTVFKCCPDQKSLDMTNANHPSCVNAPGQASPFIRIKGLDLDNDDQREVEIQLTKDQSKPFAIPPCYSEFEAHRIEHSGNEMTNNVIFENM